MESFKITSSQAIQPFQVEGDITGEPIWLILSTEELERYHHLFNWHAQTISACKRMQWLSQVEVYDHYDFGVLQHVLWQRKAFSFHTFAFYISASYLIIIEKEPSAWMAHFCHQLLEEKEQRFSLGYIFFRLLDSLIQSDQNDLDHLLDIMGQLEERVLYNQVTHFSNDIIDIRKHVATFKRHYDPLTDIIEDLLSNDNEICSVETIRYFKILKNRLKRLNSQVEQLNDYADHIREAYDAQVEIKQNRIMQYFTLIASIFLPLTLITGWYGMNFQVMPELTWRYGYLYVVGLSIGSSMLCMWIFKKKKWM